MNNKLSFDEEEIKAHQKLIAEINLNEIAKEGLFQIDPFATQKKETLRI